MVTSYRVISILIDIIIVGAIFYCVVRNKYVKDRHQKTMEIHSFNGWSMDSVLICHSFSTIFWVLGDKCPLLILSTSLKSPITCMKLEPGSTINLGDEISPFIMDLQLLEGQTIVEFERFN